MGMRKLRLLIPGAIYHVTSRLNNGFMGLKERPMKILFMEVLRQAHDLFDYELLNFTIMDNHFHLLIKPGKETNLSDLMGWIKSVFAIRWNKAHGSSGHVWGERFYSRPIKEEDIEELEAIFAYIVDNPVKANKVKRARDWEYSGLWQYINGIKTILKEIPEYVKGMYEVWMRC